QSIQVLEGLDAVRKRPAMYIGSTDVKGLHHLAYEIIDNAVDEALAGYGNEIDVILHKDNSVSIKDDGRGIPTGQHETGVSTTEVIVTVSNGGGKFGEGGYEISGGIDGGSAVVVTAISASPAVTTGRNRKKYTHRYEDGAQPVAS